MGNMIENRKYRDIEDFVESKQAEIRRILGEMEDYIAKGGARTIMFDETLEIETDDSTWTLTGIDINASGGVAVLSEDGDRTFLGLLGIGERYEVTMRLFMYFEGKAEW